MKREKLLNKLPKKTIAGILFIVTGSLQAASNQNALIESLVKCKASPQEVTEFNVMVDDDKVDLKPDSDLIIWGGKAWKLPSKIAIGKNKSATFVMNSRAEFYLFFVSKEPRKAMKDIARELNLENVLDTQGYLDYRRSEGYGVVRTLSADEADANYYIGCAYNG